MMGNSTKNSRYTGIALKMLSLALLGISGCGVPDAVLWLPDSSGIVFSDKDGSRLVHFDLTTQASRVIVPDTNASTPWPGLRADGKRIAVAKVEEFKTKDSDQSLVRTQVLIYDFDGHLVKESSVSEYSSELEEPSEATETEIRQSALNWDGPPEKIIVFGGEAAVYDCEKDTWIQFEDLIPWPIGNIPMRPDGKGFVAIVDSGEGEELCIVDWNGKIARFDDRALLGEKSDPLLTSEWNGDVFLLIFGDEILEYDTSSMKASRKKKSIDLVPSDGELTAFYRFPGNESQLCQFTTKKAEDSDFKEEQWKLEIQIPALGKRKVLFTSREYTSFVTFFPSPDNKKVALEFMDRKDDKREIVVVDNNGDILATVKPE